MKKLIAAAFATLALHAHALEPDFGEVTFIDGGRLDGVQLFGVKIDLNTDEHWKTYWKFAGQNGLDPVFDFNASENIAKVDVYWPKPHLIGEDGFKAVGFDDDLTIMFAITPRMDSAPVELNLAMNIGVCQNICVPLHRDFSASLNTNYAIDGVDLQLAKSSSFAPSCPFSPESETEFNAIKSNEHPDKFLVIRENTARLIAELEPQQDEAELVLIVDKSGAAPVCTNGN